jgi:peptidoglycan hydrolase CwlO-like protein
MNDRSKEKKSTIILMIASIFSIFLFGVSIVHAEDPDKELSQEEKEKLEEKEEKYEEEKEEYEEKLEKEEKKKADLQGNLSAVNSSLGATQRTIDDVIEDIEEKEKDIERHDAQIKELQDRIILYKGSLSETMRRYYFAQNNRSIVAIIENDGTDRFLDKTDSLEQLRSQVVEAVHKVDNAKNSQEQKKNELSDLKEEKEKLLAEHRSVESTLLAQSAAVRTEIIKVDTSMAELNAKLSAVEGKLSALLGKSFNTDDIADAAKFASKKTGVSKSFILGMLVVETNLGRYTGGCIYKESKMGDANEKIFKRICKDLDYNYKKKKVSCPLSYGIGGAMGVAQFMPTTWSGYESKIAKYTGHSPPDPWSLTDGVMAMAIKLANDGATKDSGEFDAARRYYCGSNIGRSVCIDYANKVLYWSKNYKDRL